MRLQTNFDIVNHSWGYTAPFSSNQDAQGPQDVEFIKALSDSAANGRGVLAPSWWSRPAMDARMMSMHRAMVCAAQFRQ